MREPIAFLTVIRLTPYVFAISDSVMILSPGLYLPLLISFSTVSIS